MKERPILFTGEMVRAILDGRKTQTRRPVKPQPFDDPKLGFSWAPRGIASNKPIYCERNVNWNPISKAMMQAGPPLGTIGDRLYVRETWRCRGGREYEYQKHQPSIMYHADAEPVEAVCNEWRPSIHMPRWASRITLEITAVRVERVQDITEEDAKAEGSFLDRCDCFPRENDNTPIQKAFKLDWCHIHGHRFAKLWQSIYGTWDANPWVWVYEFRRIMP